MGAILLSATVKVIVEEEKVTSVNQIFCWMLFGGIRILVSLASPCDQITKVSIIKWSQQETVAKSSQVHQVFGELSTDRDGRGRS